MNLSLITFFDASGGTSGICIGMARYGTKGNHWSCSKGFLMDNSRHQLLGFGIARLRNARLCLREIMLDRPSPAASPSQL